MSVKLEKSIRIQRKREIIFDFTQNYARRLEWDTFLKKAVLINVDKAAKGVKAWCVSKYGLGMETEYVSFNRPKVTAVTQSKKSLLFKSFSGSWRFGKLNENSTEVIFTYSFVLNSPFNLFQNFIKKVLMENVEQRLLDLKHSIKKTNDEG